MKIEVEIEEVDSLRNKIKKLEGIIADQKAYIENSTQFNVSVKGKDFKGEKLNENNCDGFQPILYKGHLWRSGNRRGYAVELYDIWGKFKVTVDTKDVQLVDLKFEY